MQPPLYSGLATAAAMAFAFWYLHQRSGDRFLVYWYWTSALWALRYALGIFWSSGGLAPWPWFLPVLGVVRGLLLFWGARVLAGRGLPRWSWPVAGAFVLWSTLLAGRLTDPFVLTVAYLPINGAYLYAGWVMFGTDRFHRAERRIAAGALTFIGLLQFTYFVALVLPWYSVIGFSAVAAAQGLVAIAVLLSYLRWSLIQVGRVAHREEMALERVVSEFLTVCAHCKSVKDQGGAYVPVERYVLENTHASLEAQRCPRCTDV
jgi:hypothetical protein